MSPTPDPLLEACAAAGTACATHLDAAADAWAEAPEGLFALLQAAEGARDRIDRSVRELLGALPAHARNARRAAELAERATAAVHAVRALPVGFQRGEDAEEAERDAAEDAARAIGALRRSAAALV